MTHIAPLPSAKKKVPDLLRRSVVSLALPTSVGAGLWVAAQHVAHQSAGCDDRAATAMLVLSAALIGTGSGTAALGTWMRLRSPIPWPLASGAMLIALGSIGASAWYTESMRATWFWGCQ